MREKLNFRLILFFLIPTLLVIVWFKSGKLLATGEEGLSMYDPARTLRLYGQSLFDTHLGVPFALHIPRITYYAFASLITALFSSWIAQAVSFWVLMVTGILSTYYLSQTLTKSNNVSFYAVIFYLLNLYSQSQIWMRFLYPGMFIWAYLPLFLLLWIKWIKEKRYKFLLSFLLSTFAFSAVYGQPAYLLTLWIPAGVWLLVHLIHQRKNIFQIIIKALVGGFLWILVNIWWLYPLLSVTSLSFSGLSGWIQNFSSLRGVSKYFDLGQIAVLRQSYLFGENNHLFEFYSLNFIWFLSILAFLIMILGLIFFPKGRNKYFLITLGIISLIIVKGANPPFGFALYKFLFEKAPASAVFRNPYEKFGVVFLLVYSVFFGYGVNAIAKRFGKYRGFITITLLGLICVILVWPMWTGKVYRDNVRVEIPSYYVEADNYLSNRKDDGRILMLPMIQGDSIGYKWGYRGGEHSWFLFDRAVVSRFWRNSPAGTKYSDLYYAFESDSDWEGLLTQMNIKYLVLRNDIKAKDDTLYEESRKKLEKSENIEFMHVFGDLDIYEFRWSKDPSKFVIKKDGKLENITYKKDNARKYVVQVNGDEEELIFKETFDKRWVAKIDSKEVKDHFLVDNYANGWRINTKEKTSIDVVFKVWPWE